MKQTTENNKTKQNAPPGEIPGGKSEESRFFDRLLLMADHGVDHARSFERYQLQSEEVMLAPTVADMTMTNEQTTGFYDADQGPMVGVGTQPLDYELADAQTSADLASFLSRPVRIQLFTWSQAEAIGTPIGNIPVWHTFMNNPAIKNKLANYAFIRGNLKLKIVTNASPFMYGSLRAVYRPLPAFKSSTIRSLAPSALIPYSQLPGVWVTPAHSEGAEFTCPFICQRSFLRLGVAQEIIDMGKVDLVVYNPLLSANGSTSSVSVQIYAWMEDVVLAGPSLVATLQADEYGVGAVSAPATAVAAAARGMTQVPVIGKFARATEMGASAVGNIAKLFGFTNVPVIEDTKPVRNSPFPQLATSEIGYVNEKLALDPKNELSIDPSIAGLSGHDELAISSFAQRESYLTGVSWSSAQGIDTPLFTTRVEPQLGLIVGTQMDFTPLGLLSTLFKNWRGDIIFRFKFIATPFHKGRVRISYDPYSATVQTTGDTGPYVYNRIVDLGAETDVEMRIPYQQALPWCYTNPFPSAHWTTSSSPALTLTDTFHNGMVSVKVLTSLTGPTTTASVGMQVFVRGAENIEFSNPYVGNYDVTPFALQSEEYYDQGNAVPDALGVTSDSSTKRALVNFGEAIRSLRTLMRRQNYLDTVYIPAPTANTEGVFRISQTRFPPHFGYDIGGSNLVSGTLVPGSNFNFNLVNVSPWHLVSNCFLAQRGSMIWTYNPSKGSTGIVSRITRNNGTFAGNSQQYFSTLNTNTNIIEYGLWRWTTATGAGSSLTHTSTTNGHSVVAPSYSPFKFQTTQPSCTTSPGNAGVGTFDGTIYDSLHIEYPYTTMAADITGTTVERYFSIGTDYNLHFFLNCPTLNYLVATTLTPV